MSATIDEVVRWCKRIGLFNICAYTLLKATFICLLNCVPFIAFTTLSIKVQQREGCCVVNTDAKEVVNMIAENINLRQTRFVLRTAPATASECVTSAKARMTLMGIIRLTFTNNRYSSLTVTTPEAAKIRKVLLRAQFPALSICRRTQNWT